MKSRWDDDEAQWLRGYEADNLEHLLNGINQKITKLRDSGASTAEILYGLPELAARLCEEDLSIEFGVVFSGLKELLDRNKREVVVQQRGDSTVWPDVNRMYLQTWWNELAAAGIDLKREVTVGGDL